MFELHKKTILSLAHKHSPVPNQVDEYTGVGNVAFVIAQSTYNPDRGMLFSSWVYTVVSRAMIDHYRKTRSEVQTVSLESQFNYVQWGGESSKAGPETRLDLSEMVLQMSPEAQEIIRVVFDSWEEIYRISVYHTPKYLRGGLIKILRSKNYTWDTIYSSINEIKTMVREIRV